MRDGGEVTELLAAWSTGQAGALDRLFSVVYEDLRRRARHQMAAQPAGHTLQATALIHEAVLKLVKDPEKHWQNRAHFLAVAARAMRQILVDHARSNDAAKRGGAAHRISFDDGPEVLANPDSDILAPDDALSALAHLDPRLSRVVELWYFGGLTADEVARVLGTSAVTVHRDWRLAKSWLRRELTKYES